MQFSAHHVLPATLLLLIINLRSAICFVDPLTLGIAGGVGLGAYSFDFLKDQTYCRMQECCNERGIPGNIQALRRNLSSSLFGQHIVQQQLIPALEAHWSPHSKSRKPLVISFHGTPGTGKNFVADLIAEALYTKGLNSKFVHKYMGRADFPVEKDADLYKMRISKEVRNGIADCPRSLFIFDEVDKMPQGIFESLTSLVDYNTLLDGRDNTKAIFIFLSNTAGVHISDVLGKLLKSGTLREETRLSHFEQFLELAAYNLDGGMKKTGLIEAHVIDHYLPFLPLEKTHVQKCIEAEFWRNGIRPKAEEVELVLKDAVIYDRTHGLFATSGCKTLEKKVAVAAWSGRRT